jgi:hypothetical protein
MNRVETNGETIERMRLPEKLARTIGGYTLGFIGLTWEVGGVLTLSPLVASAGAGLVYAGHRVIEPLNDQTYGMHNEVIPKWRRALRFNASLVPTYIGASLLGDALFGGLFTGVSLDAGDRVTSAVIGFPITYLGNRYEQHLHTGGAIMPGIIDSPVERLTARRESGLLQRFVQGLRAQPERMTN